MKISKPCMAEIEYELRLENGEVFDKSEEGKALEVVIGAGQLIPGLENALEGKSEGDSFEATIDASDGYGELHADMIKTLKREDFPPDLELIPGTMFQNEGPHGVMPFCIKEVKDDEVIVDFNHPLAGKRLTFKVKVIKVRALSEEEIETLSAVADPGDGCSGCCSGCGSEGHGCDA